MRHHMRYVRVRDYGRRALFDRVELHLENRGSNEIQPVPDSCEIESKLPH